MIMANVLAFVKTMRTQSVGDSYRHIRNSKRIFEPLLEKEKKFDYRFYAQCVAEQSFEKLEMYAIELLFKG